MLELNTRGSWHNTWLYHENKR